MKEKKQVAITSKNKAFKYWNKLYIKAVKEETTRKKRKR
jgi:hypothetical protein